MPDEIFANARLAAIYDALDPDRRDLDVATMTANVARAIVHPGDWAATLAGARNAVLTSDPTLRSRERDEVEGDLRAAGFEVEEVRDAPDRPGQEFVFVARR